LREEKYLAQVQIVTKSGDFCCKMLFFRKKFAHIEKIS